MTKEGHFRTKTSVKRRNRLPGIDYSVVPKSRANKQKIAMIFKKYEKLINRGKTQAEAFEILGAKYDRDPRTISRWIKLYNDETAAQQAAKIRSETSLHTEIALRIHALTVHQEWLTSVARLLLKRKLETIKSVPGEQDRYYYPLKKTKISKKVLSSLLADNMQDVEVEYGDKFNGFLSHLHFALKNTELDGKDIDYIIKTNPYRLVQEARLGWISHRFKGQCEFCQDI